MAEAKTLATVDKVDGHKRLRLRNWQKKFICALKESPHVALACKVAGISREIAYRTRRNDPAFAEAWQEAIESSLDDLEVKCFQEAAKGNTALLQFLLKAHRRTTYADTQRHEHLVAGKIIFLPQKVEGDE
jgi:hypothetical protein